MDKQQDKISLSKVYVWDWPNQVLTMLHVSTFLSGLWKMQSSNTLSDRMSLIRSSISHQPKLPPPQKWIPAVLLYQLTSTPNQLSFHIDVFSVSITDTRTTCITGRAKWKGYLSNSIVRIKACKKLQKSWSPAIHTTMFQLILLPWQMLRLHKPQQIQEQTSGHRVCTSDSLAFSFSSSLPAYSSSFQSMEDIYCC